MTRLADLFAKAAQHGLFANVPVRPGLKREIRRDRTGRTEARWVKTEPARKIRHFAATSSSLRGKHADLGVMVNATANGTALGVKEGRAWGMDNGAYSGKFDPVVLLNAMDKYRAHRGTCKFVVSPDVLGDGRATEAMHRVWGPVIRRAGYPVAFVLHRGTTRLPDCDALFVPAMNLDDPHVPRIVEEARRAGKWVHVGRVNSAQRTASMHRLGANSVDGTHTAFVGVERGTAKMAAWMDAANATGNAPTLLQEDRKPEPRAAYWARIEPDQHAGEAMTHGAQPLATLAEHEIDEGMLVGHKGRVGVLLTAPEDGWVKVTFGNPLNDEAGMEDMEELPTHAVYGPVTLDRPHRADSLTPWQMAGQQKPQKKRRKHQ
ncbi:hypothetical protein [Deinococcus sp. 23YEL01]|uniref:hypothetical protein n=1 Tax=Deinococcus sp. 23YEL01 TaxID=2745871 RepID=UPI001E59C35A|nr:hypothetical protein [Deinococcus sp. 23YEL01]MCD0168065.1 hypothetical protein [Deinococcus sp. 23YEL01]